MEEICTIYRKTPSIGLLSATLSLQLVMKNSQANPYEFFPKKIILKIIITENRLDVKGGVDCSSLLEENIGSSLNEVIGTP